ncbi:MAG: T9SS type A sorting domain-containing protein, partial [candidate division Zixibacteria bacterium]|nr:T9SS type A sorting domain-containing protein [candidate division Zixibacteria bacterium]
VQILLNDGHGNFESSPEFYNVSEPNCLFASDFDSDLDIDLAVALYGTSRIHILLNDGDGTFSHAGWHLPGSGPYTIYAADFDSDSDNDLVVGNNNSDNISVFMNDGSGYFQQAVNYQVGNNPRSVLAEDFDADGDYDIAVVCTHSHAIGILLNNGDGTFASAVPYGCEHQPNCVCSADLDKDGDVDLAVSSYTHANITVLMNNGNGTFQQPIKYKVGSRPNWIVAADFGGDGDYDLATAHSLSGNIGVLFNNGDGTFPISEYFRYGVVYSSISSMYAADFDGDYDKDLVVTNHDYDNISVLFNLSDTISSTCASIELFPDDFPVEVPPGGSFGVTGALTNPTNEPIYHDAWGGVRVSDSVVFCHFYLSHPLNPPGESFVEYAIQNVPDTIQPGAYQFVGYCGYYELGVVCDSDYFEFTVLGESGTDIPSNSDIPAVTALFDNYPNPFNSETKISYDLAASALLNINVYNLLGQRIDVLYNGYQEGGSYDVTWDASEFASGIYFYKLTADGMVLINRMTLLK